MRLAKVVFCFGMFSALGLAQSDRGTLTGTVSDTTGATIPGASLQVRNTQTGAVYTGATSATGNYTLAQLPAGQYEMNVAAPGFKKFVRTGIIVDVAQTYRVDATLEVGAQSESVTVTEAAPLLKTDSGELSHNIEMNTVDNLRFFPPALPPARRASVTPIP